MQRRPIRRLQPADSIHNITANVLRVLPVETIEITREDVFRRLVGDEKPMARRRQLLMRIFGRPTGILGRLGGVIMARANRDAAAQVIELLNIRADDKVLEVGFGPGVAIQLLLQRLHTGSVAGVDHSQEMVRQAAARNAEALRNRSVDLATGQQNGCRLPTRPSTRHSQSIRCRCGRMRTLDCRRYGACSSMVASWHLASLSTPVSQNRALRSRSPMPALRTRSWSIDRNSSARSR